ncbi:MAG: hypothetical protein LBU18_06625 [Treponema sp.]|nr:hypothetical protein [Treponema sp.]
MSASFFLIFAAASAIRYLHIWVDAARLIPPGKWEEGASLISAGQWALPITLYLSSLLSLSYSVQKAFSFPLSFLCIFVMSCILTAGLSVGLFQANSASGLPEKTMPSVLGGPGLIITQGETAVILLEGPSNPEGARVIAAPSRPLAYQKTTTAGNIDAGLLSVPFRVGGPDFITSMFLDFSLAAEQFKERLNLGLITFSIYLGSLCFLLSSLRFVMELTSWPLANIFLSVLVFRGILAAGIFLDSPEIQQFIRPLLEKDIPGSMVCPAVFSGAAVLVILYTVLVNLARGRKTT